MSGQGGDRAGKPAPGMSSYLQGFLDRRPGSKPSSVASSRNVSEGKPDEDPLVLGDIRMARVEAYRKGKQASRGSSPVEEDSAVSSNVSSAPPKASTAKKQDEPKGKEKEPKPKLKEPSPFGSDGDDPFNFEDVEVSFGEMEKDKGPRTAKSDKVKHAASAKMEDPFGGFDSFGDDNWDFDDWGDGFNSTSSKKKSATRREEKTESKKELDPKGASEAKSSPETEGFSTKSDVVPKESHAVPQSTTVEQHLPIDKQQPPVSVVDAEKDSETGAEASTRVGALEEDLKNAQGQVSELRKRLDASQRNETELVEQLEKERKENDLLRTEVSTLEEKLVQTLNSIDSQVNSVASETHRRSQEELQSALEEERSRSEKSLGEMQQSVMKEARRSVERELRKEHEKEKLDAVAAAKKEWEASLEDLIVKSRREGARDQAEEFKMARAQWSKQRLEMQNEISKKESELAAALSEVHSMGTNATRDELAAVAAITKDTENQASKAMESAQASWNSERSELKAELAAARSEVERLSKAFAISAKEHQAALEEKDSEMDLVRSEAKRMETEWLAEADAMTRDIERLRGEVEKRIPSRTPSPEPAQDIDAKEYELQRSQEELATRIADFEAMQSEFSKEKEEILAKSVRESEELAKRVQECELAATTMEEAFEEERRELETMYLRQMKDWETEQRALLENEKNKFERETKRKLMEDYETHNSNLREKYENMLAEYRKNMQDEEAKRAKHIIDQNMKRKNFDVELERRLTEEKVNFEMEIRGKYEKELEAAQKKFADRLHAVEADFSRERQELNLGRRSREEEMAKDRQVAEDEIRASYEELLSKMQTRYEAALSEKETSLQKSRQETMEVKSTMMERMEVTRAELEQMFKSSNEEFFDHREKELRETFEIKMESERGKWEKASQAQLRRIERLEREREEAVQNVQDASQRELEAVRSEMLKAQVESRKKYTESLRAQLDEEQRKFQDAINTMQANHDKEVRSLIEQNERDHVEWATELGEVERRHKEEMAEKDRAWHRAVDKKTRDVTDHVKKLESQVAEKENSMLISKKSEEERVSKIVSEKVAEKENIFEEMSAAKEEEWEKERQRLEDLALQLEKKNIQLVAKSKAALRELHDQVREQVMTEYIAHAEQEGKTHAEQITKACSHMKKIHAHDLERMEKHYQSLLETATATSETNMLAAREDQRAMAEKLQEEFASALESTRKAAERERADMAARYQEASAAQARAAEEERSSLMKEYEKKLAECSEGYKKLFKERDDLVRSKMEEWTRAISEAQENVVKAKQEAEDQMEQRLAQFKASLEQKVHTADREAVSKLENEQKLRFDAEESKVHLERQLRKLRIASSLWKKDYQREVNARYETLVTELEERANFLLAETDSKFIKEREIHYKELAKRNQILAEELKVLNATEANRRQRNDEDSAELRHLLHQVEVLWEEFDISDVERMAFMKKALKESTRGLGAAIDVSLNEIEYVKDHQSVTALMRQRERVSRDYRQTSTAASYLQNELGESYGNKLKHEMAFLDQKLQDEARGFEEKWGRSLSRRQDVMDEATQAAAELQMRLTHSKRSSALSPSRKGAESSLDQHSRRPLADRNTSENPPQRQLPNPPVSSETGSHVGTDNANSEAARNSPRPAAPPQAATNQQTPLPPRKGGLQH